jgi:hypothetical protein
MLNSKRFLAVLVAGIVFLVGVFVFHTEPIAFATAEMIIVAPYLAAQTLRGSNEELKK